MRRGASGINCLIAVNKPVGITSHDAVSRVRRAVGESRVGHAGTLDPAATGVLVVGIGNATRLLGLLTLDEKSYVARIAFGSETSTDDAEGEVELTAYDQDRLHDLDFARATIESLVGEQDQIPPFYSAISVDGKRAYQRVRAGEEFELAPRRITIASAELYGIEEDEEGPVWRCGFRVSKGTYIRALARDLGRSLGSAAHLAGLVRMTAGPISIDRCTPLDELEDKGAALLPEVRLDPTWALQMPVRLLDDQELEDVRCGRRLDCGLVSEPGTHSAFPRQPREGEQVSLVAHERLMGVWRRQGAKLVCDVNFPVGIEGVRA